MHTLTNSIDRANPFGDRITASPNHFADPQQLIASLGQSHLWRKPPIVQCLDINLRGPELRKGLSEFLSGRGEKLNSKKEKVLCETPTLGKKPTRIDRWKYDLMRSAILAEVPIDDEGVEFNRLAELVERRIPAEDLKRLGSVSWYATTVKLDLEVKGEIERIPGATPQRLRRIHK